MKASKFAVCCSWVLMVALFCSCGNAGAKPDAQTILTMELTENYDDSAPFVDAKLFCVSENMDTVELAVTFQMKGESGIIEIADNDTKEVLWTNAWAGDTEANTCSVTLSALNKEKDYLVQFTGTGIKYAKIVVTTANKCVEALERPRR